MTGSLPRIAVVGAGHWGYNLVRVAVELGVLAAICDTDPDRLVRAQTIAPDAAITTNFIELLNGPPLDAVVLAVPASLHAQYALAAIAAGKHVFVEKPLALNSADGEAIVRAAKLANRKLFVGHLLLYHSAVRTTMKCIERGDIGEIVHVRSRRLSWGRLRSFENVWWSFAPHDVAIMIAIYGNEVPVMVHAARTEHAQAGIADFVYADFCFSGGRTAHIEVSWLDVEKSARLDVFGTSGVLTFTDSREAASLRLTPAGVRDIAETPTLWRSPSIDIPFAKDEPLKAELRAFVDWIVADICPPTDGQEGLNVVRVLEMTQLAMESAAYPGEVFA